MTAGHSDFEVLAITHKYPPSVGGMQKQSYELIKNLESFTIVHKIIFSQKYPKALFFIFAVPLVLIKLWRHPKIRLVHANDGLMAPFITPLLWLTNTRLAATVHGLDVVFKSAPYQYWVRKCLSRFSLVVAVSEETRQECLSRGLSADKVFYIPNGFEPATGFLPNEALLESVQQRMGVDFSGKTTLMSIGRPIKRKGFTWVVQNVLEQLNEPYIYIVAGPREKHMAFLRFLSTVLPLGLFRSLSHAFGFGMEALLLDTLTNDERYRGKVVFTGHLPQAELEQLLFHADLLLMPNLKVEGDYEGFGLVALEAASLGTVCLAASVDGIPSAVKHEVNGILLPSGDPAAWSGAINELAKDPERLKKIGQTFKANTEAQSHSWHEMASAYFTLFTQPDKRSTE